MEANATSSSNVLTSQTAMFSVYVSLLLPSSACSVFLLVQLARKPIVRSSICNHIIVMILLCSFFQVLTELPIVLYSLYRKVSPIQTDVFCQLWSYLDYVCNVSLLMQMCYGSIERYMLIFHRHVIQQHQWLLHYIPIGVCVLYPVVIYAVLIFLYPCVNQFDFTMITCGGPCYFREPTLSTFDQFFNITMPVLLGTAANVLLVVRVLNGKRRMKRQKIWKKNLRLIIQLLSVVLLHNLVWIPMLCTTLLMLYSSDNQALWIDLSINVLPYGIYVVILLCPFVSLMSLAELWPARFRHQKLPMRTCNTIQPAKM